MRLAGAHQQRQQPVMEDVQEVAKPVILAPRALDDAVAVGVGQRPLRAGQGEKVDGHRGRIARILGSLDGLHFGPRKYVAHLRVEADHLFVRVDALAGRHVLGMQQFQQPHRLEELELPWLGEQPFADGSDPCCRQPNSGIRAAVPLQFSAEAPIFPYSRPKTCSILRRTAPCRKPPDNVPAS